MIIVSAQANLMGLLATPPAAELGLYNTALKSFAFPWFLEKGTNCLNKKI